MTIDAVQVRMPSAILKNIDAIWEIISPSTEWTGRFGTNAKSTMGELRKR